MTSSTAGSLPGQAARPGVGVGPHAPEEGGAAGSPPGQAARPGVGVGIHAPEASGAPGPPPGNVIDAVIPARNEAETIGAVVEAVRSFHLVREVIVVDDGSVDGTGHLAGAAGAKVIRLEKGGSKAHALRAGVESSDAPSLLFVDGDVIGLTPDHLEDVCRPYLEGRAALSLGTFDYGWWNPFVLRMPPTSGERILPRWVFEAVPRHKLDGYTIEVMLNEVICECRLPWSAAVMRGVTHRTKREKLGRVEGYRQTWRMFWKLIGLLRVVRLRTYWFYLRDLTIEPVAGEPVAGVAPTS